MAAMPVITLGSAARQQRIETGLRVNLISRISAYISSAVSGARRSGNGTTRPTPLRPVTTSFLNYPTTALPRWFQSRPPICWCCLEDCCFADVGLDDPQPETESSSFRQIHHSVEWLPSRFGWAD